MATIGDRLQALTVANQSASNWQEKETFIQNELPTESHSSIEQPS